MYLHLGQETVVRLREVVGIFDMENATISKYTRQFLADAEKGGRVCNVTMERPKSFVLCVDRDGTETVYISQISSDRKSTRLNSSHEFVSRMPSSA